VQKAVDATKAQESIGLLMDAILLTQVRIATGNNALGAHLISFRGKWENAEKESPDDELGRVQ